MSACIPSKEHKSGDFFRPSHSHFLKIFAFPQLIVCARFSYAAVASLQRFETGVFDALLETLAEMVERDTSADMIDSTVVRAHHCAVGLKRGIKRPRGLAARAEASPPNSMPAAMAKGDRSALS